MLPPAGGAKPRWEKQLPEVARYLGWCTWDAFYHDVSAQGIAAGLQSFNQAGVQPRWIIIDDGWQVRGMRAGCAHAMAHLNMARSVAGFVHTPLLAEAEVRCAANRRGRLVHAVCQIRQPDSAVLGLHKYMSAQPR
jgi:hypothetical protein